MDKNTKMILGLGLLAAAGYLVWKQTQKPKPAAFMNAAARTSIGGGLTVQACCGHTGKDADGKFICCNGEKAWNSLGYACGSQQMKDCASKGLTAL